MTFLARLRRFARATGGLAALEFAMLAPIMILLLFGSVELIDALGANRRAQNVASSLADVVARDTEVDDDEVEGLWGALDIMMFPDDGTSMQVCITSVSMDSSGSPSAVWSEYHDATPGDNSDNLGCPSANALNLNASMRVPNSSVIVAETSYNYSPPLNFLFNGGFPMRHIVYRRSRLVDPIPRV